MSSKNAICLRAQVAIANYLGGLTFTWSPTILRGITADRKTLPAIICNSSDAEAAVSQMTGDWIATCQVMVRENADDTEEDDHLTHFGEVMDAIVTDSIAVDITAAYVGEFTAECVTPIRQTTELIDRSFQSTFTFTILCHPN